MIKPTGYRQFRVVERTFKGHTDYALSYRDKMLPLPFMWGAWHFDEAFWIQEVAENEAKARAMRYNRKPEKPKKKTIGIFG